MSARTLARAAALEKRLAEINDHACSGIDGVHAIEGYLLSVRDRAKDRDIHLAIGAIQWMVDTLHAEFDRIADLGDFAAEPLDEEAEIER